MDQEQTLDEIFANEPEKPAKATEAETPAEVAETDEMALADGSGADTGDTESDDAENDAESEDSTPESSKDDEKETSWTYAAYKDEKQKRQEQEKENRKLAEELAELKRKFEEREPKKEPASFFEDENKAFEDRWSEKEEKLFQRDLVLSQRLARFEHEDYAEMESVFVELAKQDPRLAIELRKQPDPAEWAYMVGKHHSMMQKLEDPEAYEAELRAKWEAEREAEQQERAEKESQKRQSITPSLAGSRSKGGTKSLGPEPSLDDILNTR